MSQLLNDHFCDQRSEIRQIHLILTSRISPKILCSVIWWMCSQMQIILSFYRVVSLNKSPLISFVQLSGRIKQQGLHLPTPDPQEVLTNLIRIPCPFLPISRSTRLLIDTFYLRGHPYYHPLTSPINPVPYIINFREKMVQASLGIQSSIVGTLRAIPYIFHVAVQFFSTSSTWRYTNSSQHLPRGATLTVLNIFHVTLH